MTANKDAARARVYEIVRTKSFVRGHVVLASGQVSDHYFDMKPSMFDPEGATLLADLILAQFEGLPVDLVGGLEMGAVPLIGPIIVASQKAGRPIPGFFVRKAAKDHGTKKLIDGVGSVAGKSIAIVEDVTTTGGSAMKAVTALQEAGGKIVLVISILDRLQGAAELYQKAGIPFKSLFTSREFLEA